MVTATFEKARKVDPRAARTRALLEAALDQLLSRGSFDDVTIQAITDEATINRATFYSHFRDKYDLYDELVEDHFRATVRSRLAEDAPFDERGVQALALAVCDGLVQFHTKCKIQKRQTEPRAHACFQRVAREVIDDWLRTIPKEKTADLVPESVAASLAAGAIFGAAWEWSEHYRPTPADRFVERALPTLLAAFAGWFERRTVGTSPAG